MNNNNHNNNNNLFLPKKKEITINCENSKHQITKINQDFHMVKI